MVGSEAIVTAVADDTSDTGAIAVSSDELISIAEAGPAVRQAQMQLAAAKQSSRAAKTDYLPTLSVSWGLSYAGADPAFRFTGDPRLRNLSTSLNVSLPIFNGFTREQQVVTARVAQENAEATFRDSRLIQRQQMTQQLGAFRTAEAQIEIQLASVQAGEEDLRVQQERYNLGASTLLDLLTSQTTLDVARQALIQARLDARTAKAQIEQLIGRDL